MSDDTTPRRVRGQKDQDAAYRAGYIDGYQAGLDYARKLKDEDAEREKLIARGLERHRAERAGVPKRTRRKRVDREREDTTNANVAHDVVTGDRT